MTTKEILNQYILKTFKGVQSGTYVYPPTREGLNEAFRQARKDRGRFLIVRNNELVEFAEFH
jgi:hypothetical protein